MRSLILVSIFSVLAVGASQVKASNRAPSLTTINIKDGQTKVNTDYHIIGTCAPRNAKITLDVWVYAGTDWVYVYFQTYYADEVGVFAWTSDFNSEQCYQLVIKVWQGLANDENTFTIYT